MIKAIQNNTESSSQATEMSPRKFTSWQVLLGLTFLILLLIWPQFTTNKFYFTMGTMIALSVIGASSLNLIIRTGHISLAHAAFMGVAAYTCVLSQIYFHINFALACALGCSMSAFLALILGPILLRLTGKYFVLVTFMVGEIIRLVFINWQSLTGGSNGIQEIPRGLDLFKNPTSFYYFSLLISFLCIVFVRRILSSDLGRAIDSLREVESLAECSGIPVSKIKISMFVIACFLVGFQGILQVYLVGYIDPGSFNSEASLNMVVMNVIGGMYHLSGPILGSIFITTLPEFLRGYVDFQRVIFGVVLIVVMAALPGGLMGILFKLKVFLLKALHLEVKNK